jgi:tRNA threonylcarbamoyladenosine biosynthesis protein TsaB
MASQDDWMLGIDTSAEVVSLALLPVGTDYGAAGAELTWDAGRSQTATVLAEVDRLCRLCAVETTDFSAVAVATGPGGFNSLRVGLSIAKGFAFALDIPIFGVGTLDVGAQAAAGWSLPVRAFVTAGRGRVVSRDYAWRDGRLHPGGEMTSRTRGELAVGLGEPTVLMGELPEREAAHLRDQPHVVLPAAAARRRRAAGLVDLAVPRWRAGEWDDPVALEPLYVHARPAAAGD